ncbi:PCRF domain-containing protein, partial [Patescibacteria group bacterium]|nr:PCRF domain-containing protein [Patescibacteria group bacterium]
MPSRLKDLQTKIVETQKLLKIADLKKKMQKLSDEMNSPDFWNDQQTAQAVSQDFKSIKEEVERWGELEGRANDLLNCRKPKIARLMKKLKNKPENWKSNSA